MERARGSGGQVLAGVVLLMLLLVTMVPTVVLWMQHEARLTVKSRKTTTALNLAQTAVDRGYWKAKSSTGTIAQALSGQSIAGYAFDKTYTDVPGGTYRISITSTSNASITIIGEGRDSSTKETRSLSVVFQNRTIYSPLLAQGNVTYTKGMCLYWGPLMSQGSVTLDNTTSQWYFPRKFARASVVGTASNPRDTTWPLPPNTDNVEWWANYPYVPELPILDFATLRSSAAATQTLNVYGCKNSTTHTDAVTGLTVAGRAPWDGSGSCASTPPHNTHFGNSYNHPRGTGNDQTPYVWYWDGDVTLTGPGANPNAGLDAGLRGIIIVRGNLTIDAGGDYKYTGPVPANAWQEHTKLLKTTFDTNATLEYPADAGFHKTDATWDFGTATFCQPGQGCNWVNTVGIRGFVYVGGNLIIKSFLDVNGAIWVNGNVTANCPNGDPNCNSHFAGVFYDDTLSVPTLNVILVRTSWQEVSPSGAPWL